tara:strand:+ start:285 stop:560 length:276 start_codon:yes stop_codon:yes gene_type:complete
MKKGEKDKLVFDLKWGLKGLKASLVVILVIKVVLLIVVTRQNTWRKIISIALTLPKTSLDWMAVLAGIIIFIAIPFISGIKIGLSIKKKRR